ncbi:hypothetical protein SAMN03159353_103221 [Cedecea sp. NFIX57]|nr:hypothetical protein SAMN03159353_103221 [Cedecea sp. NFIX57]
MNILKIHILSPFFDTPACGDRGHTIAIGQPGAGKTAFFSDLMTDIVQRQTGRGVVVCPGMAPLSGKRQQAMLQQGGAVFICDPTTRCPGIRKPPCRRRVNR